MGLNEEVTCLCVVLSVSFAGKRNQYYNCSDSVTNKGSFTVTLRDDFILMGKGNSVFNDNFSTMEIVGGSCMHNVFSKKLLKRNSKDCFTFTYVTFLCK